MKIGGFFYSDDFKKYTVGATLVVAPDQHQKRVTTRVAPTQIVYLFYKLS